MAEASAYTLEQGLGELTRAFCDHSPEHRAVTPVTNGLLRDTGEWCFPGGPPDDTICCTPSFHQVLQCAVKPGFVRTVATFPGHLCMLGTHHPFVYSCVKARLVEVKRVSVDD